MLSFLSVFWTYVSCNKMWPHSKEHLITTKHLTKWCAFSINPFQFIAILTLTSLGVWNSWQNISYRLCAIKKKEKENKKNSVGKKKNSSVSFEHKLNLLPKLPSQALMSRSHSLCMVLCLAGDLSQLPQVTPAPPAVWQSCASGQAQVTHNLQTLHKRGAIQVHF